MTPEAAYAELVRWSRETATLASVSSVLGWDQETYMPAGGGEHRGNQLALLAGMVHDRRTDPRIGDWLGAVESGPLAKETDSPEAANVREWRRGYDRAVKLPKRLVEELAKTTSLAQHEWAEARKASDFARFRPWLEKVFGLKREEASALSEGGPLYDALLDEYEPGAKSADLAPMFADLQKRLTPLLESILGGSRRPDESIVRRDYDVDKQRALGREAAEAFGFDFEAGRLDTTTHPFCTGLGPGDVRLTTRFSPTYFNDGFFSILHETGHGLYEQGLPADKFGEPLGEAVSLGIHETQSRLWENLVGRSAAFWRHWYPKTQAAFPAALADVKEADFHRAVNAVAPSFIRVDADEVTYNLHVVVRFEIEADLLAGDLPPSDVPAAWNAKMQKYLGITPPDDRRGCLQDVHWSFGLVGYFPTYTLGNLGAAQLFAAADRDLGNLDGMLESGEFRPLLDWLRAKIHGHGMRYRPNESIRRATGKVLAADEFVRQLDAKYRGLYGL